ncbi:hypothetical protein LCGC14_2337370, partial [marine sediment metagenome]
RGLLSTKTLPSSGITWIMSNVEVVLEILFTLYIYIKILI